MNEKQIKEYVLKLTGKACLPEPLELGEAYTIELDGQITSQTDSDEQDGTFLRYYKFEPILAKIKDKKGKTIKTKDSRSMSTKLRKIIYFLWESNESDPRDSETAYEEVMNRMMNQADNFYRQTLKK